MLQLERLETRCLLSHILLVTDTVDPTNDGNVIFEADPIGVPSPSVNPPEFTFKNLLSIPVTIDVLYDGISFDVEYNGNPLASGEELTLPLEAAGGADSATFTVRHNAQGLPLVEEFVTAVPNGNFAETTLVALRGSGIPGDMTASNVDFPNITLSDILLSSEMLDVTVDVLNPGPGAILTGASIAFYVSTDEQFDGGDIEVGSSTSDPLGVNDTFTAAATLDLDDALEGDFYILAVIDPSDAIVEQSDLNNTAVSPLLRFSATGLTVADSAGDPDDHLIDFGPTSLQDAGEEAVFVTSISNAPVHITNLTIDNPAFSLEAIRIDILPAGFDPLQNSLVNLPLNTAFKTSFAADQQHNWFALEVPAETVITIDVNSGPFSKDLSPEINFYDQEGLEIGNNFVGGFFKTTEFIALREGTYYLQLTNNSDDAGTVEVTADTKELFVQHIDLSAGNNYTHSASSFMTNQVGFNEPDFNERWFSFDAVYGDVVDISFTKGLPLEIDTTVFNAIHLPTNDDFVTTTGRHYINTEIMRPSFFDPDFEELIELYDTRRLEFDIILESTGQQNNRLIDADLENNVPFPIPIYYNPQSGADHQGVLTIQTDNGNTVEVQLIGSALTGDLQPLSLEFPSSLFSHLSQSGQPLDVDLAVANLGPGGIAESADVRFYLSQDSLLGAGDLLLQNSGGQSNSILEPFVINSNQVLSETLAIPIVADGLYYVLANIDDPNSISEQNEENNVLASIQLEVSQWSTIVVDSIDQPEKANNNLDREMDFGTLAIGKKSLIDEHVAFHNRGPETLLLSDWMLADTQHYQFVSFGNLAPEERPTLNEEGDIVINPGDDARLFFFFNPQQFSPETNQLNNTLTVQTSEGETITVGVFGEVTGADLQVTETSGAPNDDALEFGDIFVRDSDVQSFTLNNLGDSNLIINDMFLLNDGSSPYEILTLIDNETLPPNGSLEIEVRLIPTVPGSKNDTIVINTNDLLNNGTQLVELTGVGVSPLLAVSEDSQVADDLDIDFGTRAIGVPSNLVPVTLSNTGNTDLLITNIGFTGMHPDAFALFDLPDGPIAPGQSHVIHVQFVSPSPADGYSADLLIDGEFGQSETLNLTGQTNQAEFTLLLPDNSPLDSTTITLETILLGDMGAQSLFIQNNGDVDLTLTTIQTLGDGYSLIAPTDNGPITLQPGDSNVLTVRFASMQAMGTGPFGGKLLIHGLVQKEIDLNIEVTSAEIELPDTVVANGLFFGEVTVGDSSIQELQITNVGTADLMLTDWSFNESDFNIVEFSTTDTLIVNPGKTETLSLIYTPSSLRPENIPNATVTFAGNDIDSPLTQVELAAHSPGIAIDIVGNTVHSFKDANEDLVHLSLTNGTGRFFLSNGKGSGANIHTVELDPSNNSKFKIWVDRKGGTTIENLISHKSLSSVTLKNVDINNSVEIHGSLDRLLANNINEGVSIRVTAPPSRPMLVKGKKIAENVDIDLAGYVRLFQFDSYENGRLTGSEFNKIKMNKGDLGADIIAERMIKKVMFRSGTLSGTLRADSIQTVLGQNVKDAIVSARNAIKNVNIRIDIVDSHFLAGFDIGMDGLVGGGDDELTPGEIRSFVWGGQYQNSHTAVGVRPIDSDLLPPTSGPLSSGEGSIRIRGKDVVTGGSGQFGFYYAEDIKTNVRQSGSFVILRVT